MSDKNPDIPKPFLRWAGSKRKLIPILRTYWRADFGRYIEPFAGSACLFFAIAPSYAVLGDSNPELTEAYHAIQNWPEQVYRLAITLPGNRDSYYRIRAMDTSWMSSVERAARFLFLNRHCFNGLYRTNARGQFNVPFAPAKTGRFPEWPSFLRAANALCRAEIHCCDFENTLSLVSAGDFVYLDPPFAATDRRRFCEYGAKCFSVDDLPRLAELLKIISGRGASFVLSYADCEVAREVFSPWPVRVVTTTRNIAGFSKYRKVDTELLVSNISISER